MYCEFNEYQMKDTVKDGSYTAHHQSLDWWAEYLIKLENNM